MRILEICEETVGETWKTSEVKLRPRPGRGFEVSMDIARRIQRICIVKLGTRAERFDAEGFIGRIKN